MRNIGNQIQYQIYMTMQNPDPNRLPVTYEEWEKLAREKLQDGPFYYIAGGAGGEQTTDNAIQFESIYTLATHASNAEQCG